MQDRGEARSSLLRRKGLPTAEGGRQEHVWPLQGGARLVGVVGGRAGFARLKKVCIVCFFAVLEARQGGDVRREKRRRLYVGDFFTLRLDA